MPGPPLGFDDPTHPGQGTSGTTVDLSGPPDPEGFGTRAASGALLLTVRSVATRLVSLGASIILARLLVPAEFGLLALGLTITTVVGFTGNVGLAAALIRRPATPERADLQTVLFVQLLVTTLSLPVLSGLIPVFGTPVAIGAIMLSSLPIAALRLGDQVMLERELVYGPIARVDVTEMLVQSALSVTLVALGAGVWGVAVALPIRAAVGTLIMWRLGPIGPLAPRLSRARARTLLGEGAVFAAQDVVGLARDQGLNVVIGSLGGFAALGAWSLTARLMLVPGVILSSLWQVAFPAMSRMRSVGGDMNSQVRRALGLTAVGLTLPVAALIGSSQTLVPVLFGPGWDAVAAALPWTAAGLLIAGPASVAFGSALFSERRGKVVLCSAVLHSVAALVVTLLLFDRYGVTAAGVATVAAGVVEVAVFGVAFRGDTFRCLSVALGPLVATALGAAAGLLLADASPTTAVALVMQVALATTVAGGALVVLARGPSRDFVRLLRSASARSRRTQAGARPGDPEEAGGERVVQR